MLAAIGLLALSPGAAQAGLDSAHDPGPVRDPAPMKNDPAKNDPAKNDNERRCLALSMYWEARSEGPRGMTAVGWVVLNRMRSADFPDTACGVVYQGGEQPPCQFSWWCDGKSDRPRHKASWAAALELAATLLGDPPPDPTRGALFFHSASIDVPWRRKRERTARILGHVYYR